MPSLFLPERSPDRKLVIHSTLTVQVMDTRNLHSVLWSVRCNIFLDRSGGGALI